MLDGRGDDGWARRPEGAPTPEDGEVVGYFQTGKVPGRMGTSSGGIMMPYETFKCADGHLIVACGNNSQWQSLCKALARSSEARWRLDWLKQE